VVAAQAGGEKALAVQAGRAPVDVQSVEQTQKQQQNQQRLQARQRATGTGRSLLRGGA